MIREIKQGTKYIGKKAAICLYRIMNGILPVKQDIIVFNASMGRNYTGNCRYIYENMVEAGLDKKYKCVWFFRNTNIELPGQARIVKYARIKYLYYMAIAKTWVFDCRQPGFLKKKEQVTYIQTWHGTPLKKLALDMDDVFMVNGKNIEEYKNNFKKNAETWDYLISQNPFSTETFRRCFDFKKTMLEIGYPRNDMLVNQNDEESILSLKQHFQLPIDKKIILYAPTWRDDEYDKNGTYKFCPKLDFDLLKENLQSEYVMIVKYHYLVEEALDWSSYEGFIYHFDDDITQMYLVSDILITDYSSVMFDFSVLKRPMFFYCYDLEKYKNQLRGFYFDFQKEAPGPISQTTDQLLCDLNDYNKEKYEARYQRFYERYNPWDDGRASEKVAQLMESINK
ncbi:MAG: CDP-glycerol glycerophosphotransferase family protein [Velocimicrobium sp.]